MSSRSPYGFFVIWGLIAAIASIALLYSLFGNTRRRSKYTRLFISLREKQIDLPGLFSEFTFTAANKNFIKPVAVDTVKSTLAALIEEPIQEEGISLIDVVYLDDLAFCLLTVSTTHANYIPGKSNNYFSTNIRHYQLWHLKLSPDSKKATLTSKPWNNEPARKYVSGFSKKLLESIG
jgi:hypothetical protein